MRPAGYTLLRRGAVRALLRDDVVTRLGAALVAPMLQPAGEGEPIAGGRGGAFRARYAGDLRVVVRPCRRGGWFGRVVTSTYVGWRPRPWRELAVSLVARARGVPTPAIVAVRVVGWGVYRGAVVTEEAADTITVAAALREPRFATRQEDMVRATAAAIGRLHAAGVEHADLNLANLLLSRHDPGAPALVIDLDKARVGRAPLAAPARRRNLRRLARSWRRIMGDTAVAPELRQAFRVAYEAAGESPCAC